MGTHSSLDEAAPRWALPKLALKNKNLAKDLPHSSSKLITDFTGMEEENLERFPRKRVRVMVHLPIIRVRCACKVNPLQTWNRFTLLGPCY